MIYQFQSSRLTPLISLSTSINCKQSKEMIMFEDRSLQNVSLQNSDIYLVHMKLGESRLEDLIIGNEFEILFGHPVDLAH